MSFRTRTVTVLGLLVLAASTLLVAAFGVGGEGGDLTVFYGYALKIVNGAVPYRDLHLEYPPGALAAIVPPALGSPSLHTFAVRFEWAMLALLAVTVTLLASRPRAAFVVAAAPLLLGPVVLKRFDVLPALLTLVALELTLRRRGEWAGVALGVATAVKLYPVLLLPLLAVRAGWRAVAAFAVACAAVFLPFFVLSPHGVVSSIHDQVGRHLQVETPLASVALLAHSFGVLSIGLVSEAHTYGLGGSSGLALAFLTTIAFVAALLFVWWNAPRLVASRDGLILAWAATLCIAVVLGRVLSPQYLVWLLPIVPLVSWRATWLLVASLVLTNVWYPEHYLDVVVHDARGGIMLLVVRNLVLIALLASLLLEIARRRGRRFLPRRG